MKIYICPEHECAGHPNACEAILAGQNHIDERMVLLMGALDNLKSADEALKTEVTTFLSDIAGRLGNPDADVQAVADDINAEVTALQGGDPATPPAVPVAPAPVDGSGDGTTPPADGSTDAPVSE